jgi:hypothetical protein
MITGLFQCSSQVNSVAMPSIQSISPVVIGPAARSV